MPRQRPRPQPAAQRATRLDPSVLELLERTEDGEVMVPYESMEIVLPLARAVA